MMTTTATRFHTMIPFYGALVSGLTLGFAAGRTVDHLWSSAAGNAWLIGLLAINVALYYVDRRRQRRRVVAAVALLNAQQRVVREWLDTHRECPACGRAMPATGGAS